MRKLIFINRYYWPDHSATSQILTDLTKNLELDGSVKHVVACRYFYSEDPRVMPKADNLEGTCIHRVWTSSFGRQNLLGRSFDYLSFYVSAFFVLLKIVKKGDYIIVKTDPPLISIVAALVATMKGAVLVNWLQDLFPEVGRQLGIRLISIEPIFTLLRLLRNMSLKMAKTNVVIGKKMADKIISECGADLSVTVIPNWSVGDHLVPVENSDNTLLRQWGLESKFVVGYSGNLGRAHDYETIFRCIESCQDATDIIFLFIGGGAGYQILQEKVKAAGVQNAIFVGYQPESNLSQSLSVPDIHLVSLEPDLEGFIVPSKFYGILAVGRPMIFIGDPNGEIGTIVRECKLGHVVSQGDCDGLISAVSHSYKNKDQLYELGSNSRSLYESRYRPETSYEKWKEVLGG